MSQKQWVVVCFDPASKALGFTAGPQGWIPPAHKSAVRHVFASFGLAFSWAMQELSGNKLWKVLPASAEIVHISEAGQGRFRSPAAPF